jgi:hypothetical protein
LLLAAVASGCSTTGAQIDGPVFGLGLELDTDLEISPRLQVGYHTAYWFDMLGYGAGAGIGYALLDNRAELFAEAQAYVVPILGFPLTPWSVGGVVAFSPEHGWELGVRGGLEVWMFKPPEACWPPLEGDWAGCPPGVYTSDDVVYPEWLPRIDFRAAFHMGVGENAGERRGVFYLGFDPVLALWNLQGTTP